MEATRAGQAPAALAKAALRRLAQIQQEPTPENFARAYALESGQPAPPDPATEARALGQAWVQLLDRLSRQLDRGGRQWTAARRKDSLRRVLDGSRSDPPRLLQRLQSLLGAWETDQAADPAETGLDPAAAAASPEPLASWPAAAQAVTQSLSDTVQAALPPHAAEAARLARRLAELGARLAQDGPEDETVQAVAEVCRQARQLLGQGHRLVAQLLDLCREMSSGLAVLAEDDGWVQGQCEQLRHALGDAPSLRGVRAAQALLHQTRQHQEQLRTERQAARLALKQLLQDMLVEVGEIGTHTGRFERAAAAHAQAIEQADSLQGLAEVVRALLDDTRAIQAAASRSHERLQTEHAQAMALQAQVQELEAELRRVSDELVTDVLTQVANRRGLAQAFEAETARVARADAGASAALAVGLIDIDNFKKLNDTLGHAAGDVALRSLAAAVRERLRPVDHLARFGGEEFVVLLPGTPPDDAQQALTRLQRGLTEALFLHEGREVFVTFSAGVTAWRAGESLEAALERADAALYEAKRTGKNRTCVQ